MLHQSFLSWKKNKEIKATTLSQCVKGSYRLSKTVVSVSFPPLLSTNRKLRAKRKPLEFQVNKHSNRKIHQLQHSLAKSPSQPSASVTSRRSPKKRRTRSSCWLHVSPETELESILSLHSPVYYLKQFKETRCGEPLDIPL